MVYLFVARKEIETPDLLRISKRFELALYKDLPSKKRDGFHYVCENEFIHESKIRDLKAQGLELISAA